MSKTVTTIYIDNELKQKAKERGITISHACAEGLRQAIGDMSTDEQILQLAEERENIKEELKQKEEELDQVERKAVKITGMTLDDYLENNKPKPLRVKNIEDFTSNIWVDRSGQSALGDMGDPETVAQIYEKKLKEYGLKTKTKRLEFVQEAKAYIDRTRDENDMMVR